MAGLKRDKAEKTSHASFLLVILSASDGDPRYNDESADHQQKRSRLRNGRVCLRRPIADESKDDEAHAKGQQHFPSSRHTTSYSFEILNSQSSERSVMIW